MLNHLPQDKLIRTYQRGKHTELQKEIWLRWGNTISNNVMVKSEGLSI